MKQISLVLLILALAGCYTVPETGRTAFILPVVDEVSEGAAAFADLKTKGKVSADAAENERVRRVGARIAQAVGGDLAGAKWEFVVFAEPKTVNAFALPGGKVGVYSGLLRVAETDSELAIVMGHEIGHVTARHGAQRVTEGLLAAVGGVILDAGSKNKSSHDTLLVGYGMAVGGSLLAFSRAHESEADYIGIRYAARAGYDPRAAITFWQKMDQEGKGSSVPAFLSTHPSHDKRTADLQKWMPEAVPLYEKARLRYQ
ncbi:MAG: M48 family peptidase [Lacunisphaera sp.]|nr:M48 family peptidase [Lacunisphaera sp.]